LQFEIADNTWKSEKVELPAKGSISFVSSISYQSYYFVTYESFIQPTTLYCDMGNGSPPRKIMSDPVHFDASDLVVNQYETASEDGTMIPYFIVHRKELALNGNNPTILYGYGGFQVSEKPYYSSSLGKLWLSQGGVYVLANIRGGGEFGPAWHRAAILENKQKSYDDFIAIANDLIRRKISSANKIGIVGGSNGGLLVGAVMTQQPELFKAVVSLVPLLDMKRYSKLLAGNSWVAEYGDPDIPEQWEYISKYSPYQKVQPGIKYPATIFLTSTRDDRVHPGHARKMTAKMESFGNEVYLYENTEGGHAATVTPEQTARLIALYYTFLIDQLMK
jgi:prolyl oligopeptidase